jgi:hypothetical protein
VEADDQVPGTAWESIDFKIEPNQIDLDPESLRSSCGHV